MKENEQYMTYQNAEDGLKEECGVFGVYDLDDNDVASTIYYGLIGSAAPWTGKLWYRSQRYRRTRMSKVCIRVWACVNECIHRKYWKD